MRILPEQVGQEHPAEDKESRILHIANHAPGEQSDFPARNIVDGGFLELVRYGIRSPDDPTIVATIKVIDAVLKTDTPAGTNLASLQPRWIWPAGRTVVLSRSMVWAACGRCSLVNAGHYELAAGHSTEAYIRAMEGACINTGLLPEQSWDEADRPEIYMWLRQAHWLRHAVDVGPCRVHQASSLHSRWQGLRRNSGSCRTLPGQARKRKRAGSLEAEPACPIHARWRDIPRAGRCAFHTPLVKRQLENRATIPSQFKMHFRLITST